MSYTLPRHAACCIEDIIAACLSDFHERQFWLVQNGDGTWDDKHVNEGRHGVNIFSTGEEPDPSIEMPIGDCGMGEKCMLLNLTVEIWVCACKDARDIAKGCLALITSRLCDCWNRPRESKMQWDKLDYDGFLIESQTDPAEGNREYAVLTANFVAGYRVDLCNPAKIKRSKARR